MFKIQVKSPQQPTREINLDIPDLLIGKDENCQIVLTGWNVAKQHVKILSSDNEVFLQDLGGLFGTWVDGVKITRYGPVKGGETVLVGGHSLLIVADEEQPVASHGRSHLDLPIRFLKSHLM